MTELKEDIAAERDQLRQENNRLRAQLAAAGAAPRGYAPAQTFQLSEGDRQELAARGIVNVGGRMRTAEEVREMLGDDQQGVELGDAEPPAGMAGGRDAGSVAGVDYVYPSVAPGQIDPAVAGTPGISGPAAPDQHGASDDTTGE
jgi:hypothetical protein